ncbi:MAG: family channel protein [Mucilaginibacter sp.]|nr:family channel protein [Mucilaginibacter sp.]
MAELIGTFILVFCGTGAMVIDQQTGGAVSHIGVSITWGLIVMSLIYSIGSVSGCHINPAVSIAFTLAGRFKARLLPGYIVSQLVGALLASLTLKLLFPTSLLLGATLPAGSEMQSFILELLLTFFLMLVIMNVAHGSKEQGQFAGIAIGAVVGLEAMFAGPICGASMNPARSIAPAIVSGHLDHLWLYIAAPVAGAALAIPVWKYLTTKQNT